MSDYSKRNVRKIIRNNSVISNKVRYCRNAMPFSGVSLQTCAFDKRSLKLQHNNEAQVTNLR